MKNKKGFTLAEVLITLTIIGIVAALTIPTLINNINEAQYTTACKNAYSTLSNALGMIQSNNQGIVHVGTATSAGTDLRNDFCNVMSCPQTYDDTSIFDNIVYFDYKGSTHYQANGDISSLEFFSSNGDASAVLNNGSYLGFFAYTDCVSTYGYPDVNICGDIIFDINGSQGPNTSGEDLFFFHIVQDNNGVYSIQPFGISDDQAPSLGNSPCADGTSGSSCAYQRIYGTMP